MGLCAALSWNCKKKLTCLSQKGFNLIDRITITNWTHPVLDSAQSH